MGWFEYEVTEWGLEMRLDFSLREKKDGSERNLIFFPAGKGAGHRLDGWMRRFAQTVREIVPDWTDGCTDLHRALENYSFDSFSHISDFEIEQ